MIRFQLARYIGAILIVAAFFSPLTLAAEEPELVKPEIGRRALIDGAGSIELVARKQGLAYGRDYDAAIHSPKSVAFHPLGRKFYVNSLEGCVTAVYDAYTFEKLSTIRHKFSSGQGELWNVPSGYYPFTHYPDGITRSFSGKPVEMAFTPDGRYLLIPYYRRSFDRNAQDPSALAVIDTNVDSIVRMIETGPLPKMVAVSGDGRLAAVTHWGDNTVGLIDISSADPVEWHHLPPVVIGKQLQLDYPLDKSVDRDKDSGRLLRGTVFLPGDSLLLVGGMASSIAVVDLRSGSHLCDINDIWSVRHLVIDKGWLYCSRNRGGDVWRVPVDSIVSGVAKRRDRVAKVHGWENQKVGRGVRTIALSPDGKLLYAVCNGSSLLAILRTEDLEPIGEIDADSYPVGVSVSPDGTTIVVTSQGRDRRGGHVVDIYRHPLFPR